MTSSSCTGDTLQPRILPWHICGRECGLLCRLQERIARRLSSSIQHRAIPLHCGGHAWRSSTISPSRTRCSTSALSSPCTHACARNSHARRLLFSLSGLQCLASLEIACRTLDIANPQRTASCGQEVPASCPSRESSTSIRCAALWSSYPYKSILFVGIFGNSTPIK